jgi:hypothetical protein
MQPSKSSKNSQIPRVLRVLRVFTTAALALAAAGPALADESISIKNFRQIYDSLKVVTAVTPDAEIQQAYREARTRLPRYGRIDEVSSPMLLAVTSLSGSFCKKMIAVDAARTDPAQRRAHRQVNFAQGPAGLSAAIKGSVAAEYAKLFWQRDPTSAEITMLTTAMDESAATVGTTAADTQKVLKVACTAVAASLESFVF